MPNTQLLKIEIGSIIDLLPLEGLKLLAEFVAFLRLKFGLDKSPLANLVLEKPLTLVESDFGDYLTNLESYEEQLAQGSIQW